MKRTYGNIVTALIALGVIVILSYGYVENIIKLVGSHETTGWVIARAFGIIMPLLGIVLGYF